MSKRVVLLGECMIELQRREGQIIQGYAGDVLNTSTYLARLTQDSPINIEFATALGRDQFSDQMVANWAQEQIGSNLVERLEHHLPGIYFIENDASGERKFYYWRNDSAAKRMFDSDALADQLLAQTDLELFYISGISLAILPPAGRTKLIQLMRSLKAKGVTLAFDNNYRPILWSSPEETEASYDEVLSLTDIALLTWDDERALRGYDSPDQIVAHCAQFDIGELVIKCSAEPCILVCEGQQTEISATAVNRVKDTTAAGDSFSAGYLAARLHGESPGTAVAWGHKLAGTVIQHYGAIIPIEAMPRL